MTDLLRHVESSINNRRLLRRGDRVLAAVSGGLDSMVLLQVLRQLAPRYRWQLAVAHFNHRLRGRASDADERLVRRTAARLRLPLAVGQADVKAFAARSKLSLEMAARKLRHEFLAQTARRRGNSVIALAHQADDQVELFFLRLLRGAGGEGLAGMKWRSPSPADGRLPLVRPLLDLRKEELRAYARAGRLRFREDASNRSTDFLRNRVRRELLPLLRRNYQPGLDLAVLRLMDIVGAEAELAGELARRWQSKTGGGPEPGGRARPVFAALPRAVQRKVLQRQLVDLGLTADFEWIEQLRAIRGRPVSVGPGLQVTRQRGGALKLATPSVTGFSSRQAVAVLAGGPGHLVFAGWKFSWTVEPTRGSRRPASRQTEYFDADRIGGRIRLRHWQAGDRFQPIGLPKPVKLQDLFTNAKIPRALRRELVVAEAEDGEIFWVEGLRIAERFKLTARTRRRLVWRRRHPAV